MSYTCYITVDANGMVIRNFTGQVDIQLTSPDNYGDYVPPACTGSRLRGMRWPRPRRPHSAPEPSTGALKALALVMGVAFHRAARSFSRACLPTIPAAIGKQHAVVELGTQPQGVARALRSTPNHEVEHDFPESL